MLGAQVVDVLGEVLVLAEHGEQAALLGVEVGLHQPGEVLAGGLHGGEVLLVARPAQHPELVDELVVLLHVAPDQLDVLAPAVGTHGTIVLPPD